MATDVLRRRLEELSNIPSQVWLDSLDDRKRKELEFHDRDRDRSRVESMDADTYERFYGNKKYYAATRRSKEYFQDWIARMAPGKVFLDYACGDGAGAISAAKAGAALAIGLDISPVSVRNATEDARRAGVERNSVFIQADAENTKLPDDSVDLVICSGMLHHLDLSHAFPELRRILAPGGRILAIEALDYNPIIKLYRHLTPQMRTEWEKAHILSLKDLRFAKRFFDIGDVRYWHISSIAGPHVPYLMPALEAVDRVLTTLPMVKYLAWIFTFELLSNKRSPPTPR
jgi:ubiquinone/menaquinone biosynthesis C-methylase UbiE